VGTLSSRGSDEWGGLLYLKEIMESLLKPGKGGRFFKTGKKRLTKKKQKKKSVLDKGRRSPQSTRVRGIPEVHKKKASCHFSRSKAIN